MANKTKHSDIVFLIPLKLSQVPAAYASCCMFVFPCLGVLGVVERVLAFPKFLGVILVALQSYCRPK